MSKELIGHEKQRAVLKNYLEKKSYRAPIILYGPEGIGKSLIAKEALDHFKQQKIHIDVIELKPESKSGGYTLEQIHSFTQEVRVKPFKNTQCVFFFDDAHRFLPVHANALLKTLEELDSSVLVFFITHNIMQILPTIRSRCLKLFFQALDDQALCQILGFKPKREVLKRASGSAKKGELLSNPDFLEVQKAFMQAILATFANRFDQINPILDQIQKVLSTKPKEWVTYLLDTLAYFQHDRVKNKYNITDLAFPENMQIVQKISCVNYPCSKLLYDKLSMLQDAIELGNSVKYVLEQAIFFVRSDP